MKLIAIVFVLTVMTASLRPCLAQDDQTSQIDWTRARELFQRQQAGETLSAEDAAYLQQAMEARRSRGRDQDRQPGQQRQPDRQPQSDGPVQIEAPGGQCTGGADSTGMVPLTEMTEPYKGESPGLYGQGRNTPPVEHVRLARAAAEMIQPLDAEGTPDPNGRIVVLTIGMSNTRTESQGLQLAAAQADDLNPALAIINGAQGGQDAQAWADPDWINRNTGIGVWDYADRQLASAGVSPLQVQAVWLKQARMAPAREGEYPGHAQRLTERMVRIVQLAKQRYPNLRIVYVSSRIYAGYASRPLNPEPYAYESAFAVRNLILQQIAGPAELNCDPQRGPVRAPVLLWGPYLWADGMTARQRDGLTWTREEFAVDGTHPNRQGAAKVGRLLLEFLRTDPTSRPWIVDADAAATAPAGG